MVDDLASPTIKVSGALSGVRVKHCTKGIGIWDWLSTDGGSEPDVVLASAGDIPTMEAVAAVAILRERFPELKIRFVNVVDLFKLMPEIMHPHGLNDEDFDSLFTKDKPVIFNFHAYASLVHKLTYKRTNHENLHVHGYHEKGNIDTPLELAMLNEVDRFSLCIDVINRVPKLRATASHVRRNGCRISRSKIARMPSERALTNQRSAIGPGRRRFRRRGMPDGRVVHHPRA